MPELPDAAAFELPPDWVCEVLSPSTQAIDRAQKRRIYAREGVAWLWLLDPLAKTLEIFRLEHRKWTVQATFTGEAPVRAEPFDVIELDLGALWERRHGRAGGATASCRLPSFTTRATPPRADTPRDRSRARGACGHRGSRRGLRGVARMSQAHRCLLGGECWGSNAAAPFGVVGHIRQPHLDAHPVLAFLLRPRSASASCSACSMVAGAVRYTPRDDASPTLDARGGLGITWRRGAATKVRERSGRGFARDSCQEQEQRDAEGTLMYQRIRSTAHVIAAVGSLLVAPGCTSSTDEDRAPAPGDAGSKPKNTFVDAITQVRVDKLDLLFMIDNSISMADKHEALRFAVPDLVRRLVNPVCVNPNLPGERREPPGDLDQPCADDGFIREFHPVRDIHIGVISSSLGTYGAETCVPDGTHPARDEQQNDQGRMIGARPRALSLGLASQPEGTPGFLQWLAGPQAAAPDIDAFASTFQSLVGTVGELGCGYEASLEAWYRFLVDPSPPAAFESYPCGGSACTRPVGLDEALLAQRAAFLRPDSAVAIIMLSDENDCSIQGTGQYYYAARSTLSLPRATPACANNPNDPCCYSCALPVPEACPIKEKPPECSGSPPVPEENDHPNLRCYEQKRRFGIDFLYPVQRYLNALKERTLCPRAADLDPSSGACSPDELMPNPLYQDLSGAGGSGRGQDLVFLAGIIGVPWQDLQASVDPRGHAYPEGELHFLTASQMLERGTWSEILGDPEPTAGAPPQLSLDPLMHESIAPRSGTTRSTGTPLAGPVSGYLANPINGHERNIPGNDDLQYACIFPLPQPRDCLLVDPALSGCDCGMASSPEDSRNPLCQAPDGTYSTVQRFAKAYPGLRFLELLRDFDYNSIVASICSRNMEDAGRQDFGYRPAVDAIVDRLGTALQTRCLPREFPVSGSTVLCSIVEAIPQSDSGCNRPGRQDADDAVIASTFARLEQLGHCGKNGSLACAPSHWTVCEITPSTSDTNASGTADCLEDGASPSDTGWCYVDPARGFGDAELVEHCHPTEKRIVRFVDREGNTPTPGATVLVACQAD
jgi:hypothetical protein